MALTKISTAMWNSVPHHDTHDFNVDDVLHVDVSANRVGIGTTSPSAALHIVSTNQLVHNYAGASQPLVWGQYNSSGDASINNQQNAALTFGTDNTARMRIDSSGVVRVGTITAQTNAAFSARRNGANIEFGHSNNTAGYYGTLGSWGGNGSPYIGFSCDNDDTLNTFTTRGFAGNIITGDTGGNLIFSQVTNVNASSQTPTERMRIDSNGRVLIGTQTEGHPNADNLTIAGTGADVGMTIRSDSDRGGKIFFSDATGGSGEYAGYIVYNHSDNSMLFGTNIIDRLKIGSGGDISFRDTSANEAFYWDASTARLGIGTTSPAYPLSIRSSGDGIKFEVSDNVDANCLIEVDGTDIKFGPSTNSDLVLMTNFTERMTIDSSGNVGIGTLNPQTKLQVDSASDFSIALSKRASTTSAIKFTLSDPTATSFTWKLEHDEFENLNLFGYSADDLVISTNSTERMRIDSSGTVQITKPATAGIAEGLVIMNPINAAGTGHGASILLHSTPGAPSRGVKIASSSTSNFALDNDMLFYTSASQTLAERMRITSSGNVTANVDMRAPIFYDSGSTAYYMDYYGGGALRGNFEFAANTTSTSYQYASIELRESNFTANGTATPPFISFHWGGVVASSIAIESSGRIAIRNNPGTAYENFIAATISATGDVIAYSSSDERLKDNQKNIDNALEKVESLNGIEFDWNDKQDTFTGHDVGVIAQEVEKVLPEIVNTRDTGYKAVKYEKLVPLLIEAIKELSEKVKILENK